QLAVAPDEPSPFPRLATATHRTFTATDPEAKLSLRYHVLVPADQPVVLLWTEVRNDAAEAQRITELGVLRTADSGVDVGVQPGTARVFVDSGGLTGSGSRKLAAPGATHSASGALVVTDGQGEAAASFSFVSFLGAWPSNRIALDEQGRPVRAVASCAYPHGYPLAPGATLRSEVLSVGAYPTGNEALERWADLVMAVEDLQPPKRCPSGWNSWYCYRLTITEDLVLENGRVMRDHWGAFGLTNVQIDHGWQDRDLVGNWVANTRFPHGLPWLSARLAEQGQTLGLWTAVSQVSEWVPWFTEHPEALFHTADGQPDVADAHWYWEPHGRTFSLDPTHPLGLAEYRAIGERLKSYGCTYNKNDFQGNLLRTNVVAGDPDISLGVPVYRRAMAAFAAGKGPDMAFHACNAPLNVAAGICDVAWTHRDLGNPAGNWEHLRAWANDFSCRYHVTGKFYWSDPDYLQVGQSTLDEAHVRMAFVALGGGPMFLSDRLPELPPERLALIAPCLPSYGKPATPVDLFTSDGYPRVWSLPVETAWGKWVVVGLFNLSDEPERLELDPARLGLPVGEPVVVWDFFAGKPVAELSVAAESMDVVLRVPVPAHTVKLLKLVRREAHPFVLATDLHLTMGGVELPQVTWDEKAGELRGVAKRAPGIRGNVMVYVPAGWKPVAGETAGRVLRVPVEFEGMERAWIVRFRKA
ncbi:MAG: alpha-galactosidase, partial [Armatimonadetes bacterium]|nr:alpha-galactosidase [Armatimonadota bacterium]